MTHVLMVSTHPTSICALTTIRPMVTQCDSTLMMMATYALPTLAMKSTCISNTSSVDVCLLVLMIKHNMGTSHEAMLSHFMPPNKITMFVTTRMVMNGMAMRVHSPPCAIMSISCIKQARTNFCVWSNMSEGKKSERESLSAALLFLLLKIIASKLLPLMEGASYFVVVSYERENCLLLSSNHARANFIVCL